MEIESLNRLYDAPEGTEETEETGGTGGTGGTEGIGNLNRDYRLNFMSGELPASDDSVLSLTSFSDYKPVPNMEYFKSKMSCSSNETTLISGMVFYNEDVKEIRRTLMSLGSQIRDMRDVCKSQVIVVGDGLKQMHSTTSEYLRDLFCKTEEDLKKWDEMLYDLSESKSLTYIIQRYIPSSMDICCIKISGPRKSDRIESRDEHDIHIHIQYPMTLILKSENRRKHNSQEWILNSFATQGFTKTLYDRHFIFMTDCGTLFDDHCLLRLIRYMLKHRKCVGTTGRQRVMSASEQDMEQEKWFSVAKFLRIIQMADYEVSYATYTGAFSLVGCLPVLPGPCGMFRYSGLLSTRIGEDCKTHTDVESSSTGVRESALNHYNDLVDISVKDTNICIENVKLAEDRIPSYSIITHGQPGAFTTWVDGAVFKFQAETTLQSLLLQRRRWINGAFSCYLWNCVVHPALIMKSPHPPLRKLFIMFLYWLQLLNYVFAMSTYGVIAGSMYISLLSLFDIDSKIALTVTVVYGFLVICFLIIHKYESYTKYLMPSVVFANAVMLVFIIAGFINEIVKWGGVINDNVGRMMTVFSAITIVCVPFVMALVSLNFKSMLYILVALIPYWLFLPTLVGTFVMYSMARFSDITWGNRVSYAKSSFQDASQNEVNDLKQTMNDTSKVILFALIIYNISVCVILILFFTEPLVIGIFITTIVGIYVIQCLISMFYFMGKHLSCKTCSQRIT